VKAVDTKIKNAELVAERRNHILNAALKLFLKKGFSATTMRDLSRETGINLASLYDYVGSKQGILTLMYADMMRFWREDMRSVVRDSASLKASSTEGTEEDRKRAALREQLSIILSGTWNRYGDLIRVLYRESFLLEEDVLKEVMASESLFVEEIAEAMRTAADPADRDEDRIDIVANLFVYLLGLMSNRKWILKRFDPDVVLEVTVDMLMGALERRAGAFDVHSS
jgi:AcrR family transcriptional regulator